MLMYVVEKKLTDEAKKDMEKVWKWQKQFDGWLKGHGAKFESVKHYLTVIGRDTYETWYTYPDITAMDDDGEITKKYKDDSEWKSMTSMQNLYFERLGSRVVKEM